MAIDRPAIGETRIAAGAKIDNLVQVGHGVKIGRNALLAAQVGIAGSTVVEDDVVLAGQVGVNGHITIGKGARATGQTGITNDVPPGSFVSGLPAVENRAWRKAASSFVQLPTLRKRVAALERRCAELERGNRLSTGNGPPDGMPGAASTRRRARTGEGGRVNPAVVVDFRLFYALRWRHGAVRIAPPLHRGSVDGCTDQ